MYLTELVQQSWTALRRNRLRSLLTMLGISWGVVSLVLFTVLKFTIGIRPSKEVEVEGLDINAHGERAYNY